MLRAVDASGNKVHALDAAKGTSYFCPACGSPMILHKGPVKVCHFKHKAKTCTDKWHYDMSEWHVSMQNLFPVDCQEIVVSSGDWIHRADVLADDTAIEFQHSPSSQEEFNDRCHFFLSQGYKMVWVFDMGDRFPNGDNVRWRNAWHVFDNVDFSDDNFALWFCDEDRVARRVRYPVGSPSRFGAFVFYPGVHLSLVDSVRAMDFFNKT